jgi:hypothetical protein
MSTSRVLPRLAAAALAGLVLAAIGFAAPAFAANAVDVNLNSVTTNVTAGSRADNFSVSFRNNTNEAFNVKVVFGVKLTGVTRDQVRIVRAPVTDLPHSESGGQIVFTDPVTIAFLARTSSTVNYAIQFLPGAPSGRATLTVEALRNNAAVGSDNKSINVKGVAVTTSKSPTAGPSTTPTGAATGAGGSTGGLVASPTFPPLQSKNNALSGVDSTGVPVALYIMGALLLGVGAVILWLLFRPRRPAGDAGFPTSDYDVVPPNLGYPAGRTTMSAGLHPTTQLPNLRADTVPSPIVANPTARHSAAADTRIAPPSDPWASQGGGGNDPIRAVTDPPA